ncbi:MAG: hypothetical protein HKN43_02760 [Rhodothermales bacterium]|nr:hypothetical protein [Rhodothermales bacterium]
MDVESLSVSPKLKSEFDDAETEILLWPLVNNALIAVNADEVTYDAARNALASSNGTATLVNYLQNEGSRIKGMDFSFRAPLLCHLAALAVEDNGCDTVYDPEQTMFFIETDDAQYALPVVKDYTVDWKSIADDIERDYEVVSDEVWALDRLLAFAEIEVDAYRRQDDDI